MRLAMVRWPACFGHPAVGAPINSCHTRAPPAAGLALHHAMLMATRPRPADILLSSGPNT